MIADLDAKESGQLPDYDVCIVGSGPAGTTVANELAGSGLRVCVLESGRLKPTHRGDLQRRVESRGIRIKDYSRERVLGGASTTWAGLSSPLDPIDFAPRPYLQLSGWPIPREEIFACYEEAAERYRFPSLAAFGAEGFGALRTAEGGGSAWSDPAWGVVEEKVFLAAAEPQNFGREFRALYEGPQVQLWLDATVLRLEGDSPVAGDPDSRVIQAVARTRSGREVRVRARVFVLATGGIENARLLLNSRSWCPDGLGNEHDQVGRYLMNHPKNYFGLLHLAEPVVGLPYWFGCLYHGFAGYAGLRLTEAEQAARGLMNSYVRLEPLFPWSDSEGIEALVLLAKHSRFLLNRFRRKSREQVVELRDYAETGDDSDLQNERKSALDWLALCWTILGDSPKVSRYLYYRLVARQKPRIRTVRLRNFMEMEPDPENRVTLGDELDPDGQPVPVVRHAPTELDRRSLVELHGVLRREFEQAGIGRLESDLGAATDWPIDQDASHHMGTTRMGADPRSSVVDLDGRVHGVENVFVAGASIFPTSGCANPTFTLVALAIRLARHLRENVLQPAREPAR